VLLWVAWLIALVAYGAEYSTSPPTTSFERAGQFGDAFGTLSSLMAALAATGAFLALRHQRESSRDQSEALDRQSFENTLFHLFDVLNQKTQGIVFTTTSVEDEHFVQNEHRGPDAFSRFLDLVSEDLSDNPTSAEVGERYTSEYTDVEGSLAHYFRMVYHILIFIHDHPTLHSLDERYEYVRFLRAQLSAPEMITVLLNCLFGGGRGQFILLAADYDFFQHISESRHPLGKYVVDLIPTPDPMVQELKMRQGNLGDPDSFRRVGSRDDPANPRYRRVGAPSGAIANLDLRRHGIVGPPLEPETASTAEGETTEQISAEPDSTVGVSGAPDLTLRRREAALKGWATRRARQLG
jgi:hypothetical protein